MERIPLDSRAVASAGYDEATQTLEIEFCSGRIYQYQGVPRGAYDWLIRSPSKGGYVSRMINDHYPYRDVTPVASPEPTDLADALRRSLAPRDDGDADGTNRQP